MQINNFMKLRVTLDNGHTMTIKPSFLPRYEKIIAKTRTIVSVNSINYLPKPITFYSGATK